MHTPGHRLTIDFGTSNTVAMLAGTDGRVRPMLFDASPLLSSGVLASGTALLTGADAVRGALAAPASWEPNPKQRIDDGTVWLGERELPAVELIAAVLERVAEEVRRVAGQIPPDVVITHPSTWRAVRRGILAQAAARAGLGTVGLVPEPVAAAAYFTTVLGEQLPEGRCLVVYDLGAGTFDVSVVRRAGDGFTVLADDGLPDIGGLYLDAQIVAHARTLARDAGDGAAEAWQRLDRPTGKVERRARQQLFNDARAAKEQLSRHPAADLHVPLAETDLHLTREEFERFARPHLARTVELTSTLLRSTGVPAAHVSGVFLVGGGSRVPLVATLLHRALRVPPTVLDSPELVVAEGALHAPVRRGEPGAPETTVRIRPPEPAAETFDSIDQRLRSRQPGVAGKARAALLERIADPDRQVARQARELWYGRGLGPIPASGPGGRTYRRRAGGGDPMIGIDFGTTNSMVAVIEQGEARLVPNAEGGFVTPSVVAITADGTTLVGAAAQRQAVMNPQYTVRSAKLRLGTDWAIERGDVRYTAQDIATLILARLHADAEVHLGGPVRAAVITVPANFDHVQRTALTEAAARAGLPVQRIVNEPTAASVTYGVRRDEEQLVLVFDLGGGTFDVSLVEIAEGVLEIKATAGDSHLGGDDWDGRLTEELHRRLELRQGLSLAGDPAARQRLREAAEAAKIELSSSSRAEIWLPHLQHGGDGPVHLYETVTREEFQALTRDLLERCKGPIARVLDDAAVTIADVDQVVLVGGASRMPGVADLVRELTGRDPNRGLVPEGVAAGAALQAGVLAGEVTQTLLLDVAALSLGVRTVDGAETLIERNTTIPTRRSGVFTTTHDNQNIVVFGIVQGDDGGRLLGRLELTGVPPAPRGVPQLEVTFDIDANAALVVTVKDLGTGAERSLTIEAEAIRAAAAGPEPPASALPARCEVTAALPTQPSGDHEADEDVFVQPA
ncbi:Hsp70 family protein [Dactylosporangium sp. McL0621]|uniref:Hsp70 family protein n=1 Tax=Dactylosporangium sp. McL0621 TaxID=3415678 RepID=UPI003CF9820C